ncbi:MAG: hypothetical protein JWQ85_381 [Mucilaginibacter sp.]|jgi:hypothetical protein|nr:hypothetical protein [Mucilaginibacter sp.]
MAKRLYPASIGKYLFTIFPFPIATGYHLLI